MYGSLWFGLGCYQDTALVCKTGPKFLSRILRNTPFPSCSFVEAAEMWKFSDTRVVVVGVQGGAERALLHPTLRNTVHAHYLALPLPRNASGTRGEGQRQSCYSYPPASSLSRPRHPERKVNPKNHIVIVSISLSPPPPPLPFAAPGKGGEG